MSIDEATERRSTLSPAKQALLARLLRGGANPGAPGAGSIPPRDPAAPAPLSAAQQRLWFLHQMDAATAAYNIALILRLRGRLDVAALERALAEIVRRHEALRTVFVLRGAAPVQEVWAPPARVLSIDDLPPVPADGRDAAVHGWAQEEANAPFDLAAHPGFRARLLRVAADEHVLVVTLHHIVSDGWSTGVLYREMAALYGAFTRGQPAPLPPLPIQYADYAAWQRARLAGPERARQVEHWRARLAGVPALLDLPTDRPRPAVQGREGAAHRFRIPRPLHERLSALARAEGATPFMALAAAWAALLHRWSGQDDVVVGTPLAGRTHPQTEPLIGFFVQTLPLRMGLAGDPSFRVLLRRVRQTTVDAYAHQDVPFDELVDELNVERSLSHAPVFQTMIALQNAAPDAGPALPGVRAEPLGVQVRTGQGYLTLYMDEDEHGLAANFQWPAELWDPPTMERLAGHLLTLMAAAAGAPDAALSRLPLLGAAERARIVARGQGPAVKVPALPVHGLFEAQAARTPYAAAVVMGDALLPYGELNARANRLARRLRVLGVGTDVRVGTCFHRCPEAAVAVLGVLKAGGAYVPLDPAAPAARRDGMIADAGVRIVVTLNGLADDLPAGLTAVRLDADPGEAEDGSNLEVPVPGDALAYVIFTSGSTGRPKGVMVPHAGLTNVALAYVAAQGLRPGERLLVLAPPTFDGFAGDFYAALVTGAAVVLHPSPAELTGRGFLDFCRRHGVTAAEPPTGLLKHLLDDLIPMAEAGLDEPVPTLWTGGEALDMERVRRWGRATGERVQIISKYGPTETSIAATAQLAYGPTAPAGEPVYVPLGTPLHNLRVHVLDRHLEPRPPGFPGELCIGGIAVARGYVGRPAATAEVFVPDPFSARPGARMYRTGDRARWTERAFEFLGRLDHQVKLRGFRIEPGEIEAALLAHPAVHRAAVVLREDRPGDPWLVAYVVPVPGSAAPSAAELRAHLGGTLPEYMLPGAFVALNELPLTANGKTDHRALPAPVRAPERDHVPPTTPAEEVIAGFWAEALGVERVGVHDNFFEIGGHSLLVARLHARIREAFPREMAIVDLFRHTTVAGQAAFVTARTDAAPAVSPAQQRGTDRAHARRSGTGSHRAGRR
jgi:amino acid adenylation domain-containing protein